MSLPPPRAVGLRGLRVAVWPRDEAGPTDPEISAALEAMAKALRREGAKVSLTARPAFAPREAFEVYLTLLSMALSGRASREELDAAAARAAEYGLEARHADAVLARAAGASHGAWLVANERRLQIRRAWGAFFRDWDVLLCPAFAMPALPHRHEAPTHALTLTIDGRPDALDRNAVLAGHHRRVPSSGQRGAARDQPGGAAVRRADRGAALRRPHHVEDGGAAGASWLGCTPPPGWA